MLLAVLLPPLAVYRRSGTFGAAFWVAVGLTLAFYLPGVFFAAWYDRLRR